MYPATQLTRSKSCSSFRNEIGRVTQRLTDTRGGFSPFVGFRLHVARTQRESQLTVVAESPLGGAFAYRAVRQAGEGTLDALAERFVRAVHPEVDGIDGFSVQADAAHRQVRAPHLPVGTRYYWVIMIPPPQVEFRLSQPPTPEHTQYCSPRSKH